MMADNERYSTHRKANLTNLLAFQCGLSSHLTNVLAAELDTPLLI